MIKRSMAWGDPLHYSRRILLEVWHDPGLSDDAQAEFMGEVDTILDLPEKESVTNKVCLPLCQNLEKAQRRVRGQLTFEYTWRPGTTDKSSSEEALLAGALEINVISGDDLIAIDWKGSCCSDPYVVVVAYPRSPGPDGKVEPVWHRTRTLQDAAAPKWNDKANFDVHWTREGTAHCMQADMRQCGTGDVMSNTTTMSHRQGLAAFQPKDTGEEPSDKEKQDIMMRDVPALQDELTHLTDKVVPAISAQISDVQEDLKLILETLRRRQGSFSSSAANGQVDENRNGSKWSQDSSVSAFRPSDKSGF